jgi:hypothetical protein
MKLTQTEHEFVCPKCKTVCTCTCGNAWKHERDKSVPYLESTWCRSCRMAYHDPSRDPDDDLDQRAYDGFNRFVR